MENGNKKILIIDSDKSEAGNLKKLLKEEGHKVETAHDGHKGLDKIDQERPTLVLLSFPLAGDIDGFEFISRLRESENTKDLPLIALFGPDKKADVDKSLGLGANVALIKGDDEQMLSTVREFLTEGGEKSERKEQEEREEEEKEAEGAEPKYIFKQLDHLKADIETIVDLPLRDVSLIALIDDLIKYAFYARASDIHFEPTEGRLIARLRIDGILHDSFVFSNKFQPGIIARIKVLAGMRTDVHQAAQDGRFKARLQKPAIAFDIRVAVVPTYYGEKAVLRLLAEQTKISKIEDLHLSKTNEAKIRHAIGQPYGMILATGPTGSGKTTTLYTILRELNSREVAIITIEDPIEYSVGGIDQIQVNAETGLTFANGLRSIVRQDPNIIMVGEIRDKETASIAVNAALTGHKLLSTLHTNDAATTLPRLLDMGIEPFLIASTVNIAIGQRLVRMICQACKIEKELMDTEYQILAKSLSSEILGEHKVLYEGKGCKECDKSGYFGRIGIYEVLEVNDEIRQAIMRHTDAAEIRKIAVKHSMTTLLEDGFQKALQGLTTIKEVLRVTRI